MSSYASQDVASANGGVSVRDQAESLGRVKFSTTMALIMSILGSSVLPVSFAFASTGILAGTLISLGVAVCNTYTCQLLLDASLHTKTTTYEELAHAVGGPWMKAFAQVSNVVLIIGNLTGDLCLLADLGSKTLVKTVHDRIEHILVAAHGRGIMLVLVICVIFPLSMFREMRALETASSAGMFVLAALFAVLTTDAVGNGFSGVTSGDVPLWSLPPLSGNVANAFALIGFSFYLHPLMMPMLQEMPPGKTGVKILGDAMVFTIMVVAMGTYSFIGAMGAAAFGKDTQGDVMMNDLITVAPWSALFVVAMLVYLSSCIPPLVLSLRCYLDFIVAGPRAPFDQRRFLGLTIGILAVPMTLAWHNPSVSARAFALTGATGVCVVCYLIPILVHFKLMFRDRGRPYSRMDEFALLEGEEDEDESYIGIPKTPWQWVVRVAWPVLVLLIGCGLSVLALVQGS